MPRFEINWKKTGVESLKYGLGFLLLGCCIELLAWKFGLPHIPAILDGAKVLWLDGTLKHDIQVSTARWIIGWIIGSGIGLVLGLTTGRVRPVRAMLEGLLTLFRGIPFISLVPLTLRVLGLAETGKIFLVAWASAWVCWVAVDGAAREIPPLLVWRAKSLGASWKKWIFRIMLPSCRDGIRTGLRTSLGLGLIVIAVAEMSGVYERSSGYWWSEGLGYRLSRSLDESRDDLMMASILTFALLGLVGDFIFFLVWSGVPIITFSLRQKKVAKLVANVIAIPLQKDTNWSKSPNLKVNKLSAGYDGKTIIDNLSFTIPAGATMSVVGPSGCGKTTLIRAIGHFTDGKFRVSGQVNTGTTGINEPGPWVGVVFQDAPVFGHMTVWDNVVFGDRFSKISIDEASQMAWHLLSEFGLESFASQKAETLSGGQRQRLALAMVLANRPQVLLLDEPFGALDAITRRQLQHFYWQHVHGKVTAIFVTHDLEEALLIGDSVRVGVASGAKVIEVNKHGLSPSEWELGENFNHMRTSLIAALEESKPSIDTEDVLNSKTMANSFSSGRRSRA